MKMAEKEYISREAAKKQMRNGCHSMEWLLASGAKTIGDAFAIILDEVPAADVRPVVLCRDCEYYFKDEDGYEMCDNSEGYDHVSEDGFCA